MSTHSRSASPFLNKARIRLMISDARVISWMILDTASRASSMSGRSRTSHFKQVLAFMPAAGASITPADDPHGPKELLQAYEAGMTAITQRFSATLVDITQAVHRGELTSEQGQKAST